LPTSSRFCKSKAENYKEFEKRIPLDGVYEHVLDLFRFYQDMGYELFFVTGRSESARKVTTDWLIDACEIWRDDYVELYMRPDGDYTADYIYKEKVLDTIIELGYNPVIAFEDRNRVVDIYRKRGLTVFQPAPGDY
jgi:acid phosphatase class B